MTFLMALACSGGDDSTAPTGETECSDLDGPGGDTGNVPNLLGAWTSSFVDFDDDCSAAGFDSSSETWIGAFEVFGSVQTSFYLTFNDEPSERFWGAVDPHGGITFTGLHEHSAGTLYSHFGGLLFHDAGLDRDVIDGALFLGMDVEGDAVIDCTAKASWKAYRSGV